VKSASPVSRLGANALRQFSTAVPVLPDLPARLDKTDNPATPDLAETPVNPEPRRIRAPSRTAAASPARLDLRAVLDKTDKLVLPDRTDSLAMMDNLAPSARPDPLDLPEMLVCPVALETMVNQEAQDKMANECTTPPAPRDRLALEGPLAKTATPDKQEAMASPDLWEDQEREAILADPETMVNPELREARDCQARMRTTARALIDLPSSLPRRPLPSSKEELEMNNKWKLVKRKFHPVDAAMLFFMFSFYFPRKSEKVG